MNSQKNSYAIILAGGHGERLWPYSTPERPKQFLDVFEGKALIRHAVENVMGVIPPERIFVVTAERYVSLTRKMLPMLPKVNVVGEPCRRDTAAAVAVACGLVLKHGGRDAVGCVVPADHWISPAGSFRRVLKDAITAASKTGSMVTLGIAPTYPATGFGYIKCGGEVELRTKTRFLRSLGFVEKPDLKTAKGYVKSGKFKWNAGMFIWNAAVLEQLFRKHAPDIGELVGKVEAAKSVRKVLNAAYPELRRISFDYAVMEKAESVVVAQCDFGWDDIGSWAAIANHFPSDARGNVVIGETDLCEVKNSIVVSRDHRTAVFGLDNIVVVHTPSATLVCAKDRVQDLKKLFAR